MITLEIPEAKINYYLPENLAECDRFQFTNISRLMWAYTCGNINLEEFKTTATFSLLNIKKEKSKEYPHEFWLKLSYLEELLFSEKENGFFNKVETTEGDKLEINQMITLRPIPYFKIGITKYIGPKADFDNMTFGQYIDGVDSIHEFHKFKNVESLKKLVNIFYRKKSIFSKNTYLPNKKKPESFNYLDPGIFFGFHTVFTAFQISLSNTSIVYNGQELDLSILFNSKSEFNSDLPGIGIKSTLYALAETGIYGDIEKVRNTNFWEIITKLYDSQKTAIDEEKKSKQNNNTQ